MHDIDLVERPVIGLYDAEALQEDQGVVADLSVPRPGEVDGADRAGHRRQVRGSKSPHQRLAIEQYLHRKTQAQGLDAIAQIGQLDSVQFDPVPVTASAMDSTSMDALASAAAVSISTR